MHTHRLLLSSLMVAIMGVTVSAYADDQDGHDHGNNNAGEHRGDNRNQAHPQQAATQQAAPHPALAQQGGQGQVSRPQWNQQPQQVKPAAPNRPAVTPTPDRQLQGWSERTNNNGWHQPPAGNNAGNPSSTPQNYQRWQGNPAIPVANPGPNTPIGNRQDSQNMAWSANRNQDQRHDANDRGRGNAGWAHADRRPNYTWVNNHYHMPFWNNNPERYRVVYRHEWPHHYDWHRYGWREDYAVVDPYWYAVITSIALSQAWSDAQLAQAINDDQLRQQLIYDADIRQQMLDSGYPADQIVYPDDGGGVPPDYQPGPQDAPYPQDSYPPDNSPQSYPQDNSQNSYPPSDNSGYAPNPYPAGTSSTSPSSPLYPGGVNSGASVANHNANQTMLFLCNAGNRAETANALQQVSAPDLSVWGTIDRFNSCKAWALGQ